MDRLIVQLGQSKVILVFIAIVGLIVGYLNYSGADPLVLPEGPIIRKDNLDSFKSFTIDFSILDNEVYKSLEIFGESPVSIGITGERRDPFVSL